MSINREHTTFHTNSIIIGCINWAFRRRGVKNKVQDKFEAKLSVPGTFFLAEIDEI